MLVAGGQCYRASSRLRPARIILLRCKSARVLALAFGAGGSAKSRSGQTLMRTTERRVGCAGSIPWGDNDAAKKQKNTDLWEENCYGGPVPNASGRVLELPQPYRVGTSYQIRAFARVRAAVGYLRGLPFVPFEVAANAPGRGLLDVDHCAGLASGAVVQCHIALDASGKQGSRKMMFGVAAVGYDDLAIE